MKYLVSLVFLTILFVVSPAHSEQLLFDNDGRADLSVFQGGTHHVISILGTAQDRQCGTERDLPTSGNFLKGLKGEVATFSPSFGIWNICHGIDRTQIYWGAAGDHPVSGDYDGDRLTDAAVFRPATGQWFIRYNDQGAKKGQKKTLQFGAAGDIALSGDFDGDKKSDYAIVHPRVDRDGLQWIIRRTKEKDISTMFGLLGDVPVPADFNGDKKDDIAVWRPWNGYWFLKKENVVQQWGLPGDIPSPSDYDGDGKADFIVYRPATATWYVLTRRGQTFEIPQGNFASRVANDSRVSSYAHPTVLDFNGDHISDFVVARVNGSGTLQFLFHSGTAFPHPAPSVEFGLSGDSVVPGDYDGDGVTDVATVRLSHGVYSWFFRRSSDVLAGLGPISFDFGLAGDQPLPADYDGDGITDVAVVRTMPNNTKRWLINYSTGRKSEPIVWGKATDKVFTADMDGDGLSDFITVREKSGQLLWNVRLADGTTLPSKLYGFPTDQVLIGDFDDDRKADIAVVRTESGTHVVFVEGKDPFVWGLDGDVLFSAQYDTTGAFNPTAFRVIGGQGVFFAKGLFGIQRTVPFGVTGDTPITPGVTVVGSNGTSDTGGNTGGSGPRLSCSSRVDVSSLGGGFVWKPVSDSNGKLAIIFPSSMAGRIRQVALVESGADRDTVLESTPNQIHFAGNLNGGRPTFRTQRSGSGYPNGVILVRVDTSGATNCVVVPNPGQRYD